MLFTNTHRITHDFFPGPTRRMGTTSIPIATALAASACGNANTTLLLAGC